MARQQNLSLPLYIASGVFALLALILALRADVSSGQNLAFIILAATLAGLTAAFPYVFELLVLRGSEQGKIKRLKREVSELRQMLSQSARAETKPIAPPPQEELSLEPEENPEPASPLLRKALSHLRRDPTSNAVSRLISGQKAKTEKPGDTTS